MDSLAVYPPEALYGRFTGGIMEIAHGWLCGPKIYEYEGVAFEFSPIIGPWPLKKNGDPKKLAGRRFYAFYKRFAGLPEKEQEKYRTGGGCRRI